MAPFLVFWGASTAFSYCRDRNYGAAPRTLRPTRTVVDVGACDGEVKWRREFTSKAHSCTPSGKYP